MRTLYLMIRGRRVMELQWHGEGKSGAVVTHGADDQMEEAVAREMSRVSGSSWHEFYRSAHEVARVLSEQSPRHVVEVISASAPPVIGGLSQAVA